MTMWRSAIGQMPDLQYIAMFEPDSTEYEEWLEKVMAEPWVRAMEDMVKWTGVWVGTEERFFEELRMRVGKEVFASPDFPSSVERLYEYIEDARDGFIARPLWFWHYKDVPEEDLDHYDVPGWGPEAPILVYTGDAAERPDYWEAMCKLLAYRDALPLTVLLFSGNDRHFQRFRTWTGSTTELLEKLGRHAPKLGPVPFFFANRFRPEEEHKNYAVFDFDPPNLIDPITRDDYLLFHEQIRRWAGVLGEVRIKISKEKRPFSRTSPESGKVERHSRTYWTIEAPRWKKPDLF